MRTYYAQNREDLLLESFFRDIEKGFYVDVGANDPVVDSVTKLFYDKGWHGINIEPITRHATALRELRPRDTVLQIGIALKKGSMPFREYPSGDGLSTFDKTMQEYYITEEHPFPTDNFKEYSVPVKPLKEVFKEQNVDHIHFLKVDTEGFEYDVLESNDWKRYRPEVICIEANHVDSSRDWRPLLIKHDYELIFFDGINEYYLAKEAGQRKEMFNYAEAVFSGMPLYYPGQQACVEEVKHSLSLEFERQLHEQRKLISDKDNELWKLNEQQRNPRFLLKTFLKETRIRIDRRANAPVTTVASLRYKSDPELTQLLEQKDTIKAEEILNYTKEHDAANIKANDSFVRQFKVRVQSFFWKIVSKLLRFCFLVAKRLIRIVKE